MSKQKFRVGVIDALPLYNELSCELKDKNGAELFLGDTVEMDGVKLLLGYRYGKFVLLPISTGFYLGIPGSSRLTRLNVVTATTDQFLLIGYTDAPIFGTIQKYIEFVPGDDKTKVWEA